MFKFKNLVTNPLVTLIAVIIFAIPSHYFEWNKSFVWVFFGIALIQLGIRIFYRFFVKK